MAQLRPLVWDDGDRVSCIQGVGILASMYADRRDLVERYLDRDEVVIQWTHRPTSWPPSYAVVRGPGSTDTVVIAGTVNAAQWAGQIVGASGVMLPNGSVTNVMWYGAALALVGELRELYSRGGPPATVNLVGHSYGAAVAYLVSLMLGRELGREKVAAMLIGSTKIIAGPTPYAEPGVCVSIRSENDAVAALPPSGPGWVLASPTVPLTWWMRYPAYRHVGEQVILDRQGRRVGHTSGPHDVPPMEGLADDPLGQHSLANYYARLVMGQLRHGSMNADAAAAAAFAAEALLLPSAMQIVRTFGVTIVTPDGQSLDVAGLPAFFFLNGEVDMDSRSIAPERVKKITLFFNWGRSGWTESYYVGAQTGTSESEIRRLAKRQAERLVKRRKEFLHRTCTIEGLRITDVNGDRGAELYLLPDIGLGAGEASLGRMDHAGNGYLVSLEALDGRLKDRRILRGCNTDMNDGLGDNWLFNSRVGGTEYQAMLGFMRQVANATDVSGLRGVMRAYDQSENVRKPTRVEYLSKDEDDHLVAHVSSNVDYSVGDVVQLSASRMQNARGVSGKYKIIDIKTAAGDVGYVLSHKTRLPINTLRELSGNVERRVDAYYPITAPYVIRWAFRKIGSAFFGTRGRQRAKSN